jgi:hypothetical protein
MGEQVEEYACALSELTANSKPIISSLTILAQEIGACDAHAAASIAGLVEKHIRTVRHKLFFLLSLHPPPPFFLFPTQDGDCHSFCKKLFVKIRATLVSLSPRRMNIHIH